MKSNFKNGAQQNKRETTLYLFIYLFIYVLLKSFSTATCAANLWLMWCTNYANRLKFAEDIGTSLLLPRFCGHYRVQYWRCRMTSQIPVRLIFGMTSV